MNKKILIPIIIVVIIIAIVGIVIFTRNNDNGNNTKTNKKEIQIGETITDKDFEFTLTRVEFADALYNINNVGSGMPLSTAREFKNEIPNYYLPMDKNSVEKWLVSGSYFTGDGKGTAKTQLSTTEDKTFITLSFNLKYLGKSETFNSNSVYDTQLDYNDGYTFSPDGTAIKSEKMENWISSGVTFHSLDDTVYECRKIFSVPKEIETNTDAPLKINFSYFNKAYTIR